MPSRWGAELACPECGLCYRDLRTGDTFASIKQEMKGGDPDDSTTWKYRRRHGVLGAWHAKKLMWWNYHLVCCEDGARGHRASTSGMTKTPIAFIADLHVGHHRRWSSDEQGVVAPLTSRALTITQVLASARRAAEAAKVTDLFVLGDVFDTSSPTPQMVAETQQALASDALTVHLIIGNHDQVSDRRGDHALVSMNGWRNLVVYEKPEVLYLEGWQVHLFPYRPGRADEYLLDGLRELVDGTDAPGEGVDRVLGLHLGLRGPETPTWLKASHDSIDAVSLPRHIYRYIYAGNWHGRHRVLPGVFQVGALVPTGFDNPGLTGYGSLMLLNDEGPTYAELDGPRFVRATSLVEARAALNAIATRVSSWPAYLSVRCTPAEREDVRELMEVYGHETFEILTDKAAAEDAARSAAAQTMQAFTSTDSIAAAVTAYVEKMALPEGTDRAKVKQLALDYIAGAGS